MRSEGDNLTKIIIIGAIRGSRSKGRPKSRWVQDVEYWLKITINDQREKYLGEASSSSRLCLSMTNGTRPDLTLL